MSALEGVPGGLERAKEEAAAIAHEWPRLAGQCERYVEAVTREFELRQAWDAAGRPITTQSGRSREFSHPMIAEIRAAEAHSMRLAEVIGLRVPATPGAGQHERVGLFQREADRPKDRQPGEPPKLVPFPGRKGAA